MQRAIWQIDPQVAFRISSRSTNRSAIRWRPTASRPWCLAGSAWPRCYWLLLGVYGVLAYSVSLGQREFGIRIALGSGKNALIRLVLRQAARPVLVGTSGGLMIALIALCWVRSLLYQTPLMDPLALGGSVLLRLVAAGIAAIVPARRAASTDPMRALRTE